MAVALLFLLRYCYQARIQGVGAGARAHPWGRVSPFRMHYSIAFKHQHITGGPVPTPGRNPVFAPGYSATFWLMETAFAAPLPSRGSASSGVADSSSAPHISEKCSAKKYVTWRQSSHVTGVDKFPDPWRLGTEPWMTKSTRNGITIDAFFMHKIRKLFFFKELVLRRSLMCLPAIKILYLSIVGNLKFCKLANK